MQIHELDGYGGNLDEKAYLAIDDGNDTGKVSAEEFLKGVTNQVETLEDTLNARIDNIIAGGTAPSEAEVTDARLGAADLGSVEYPSLGAAIRGQITALKDILNNTKNGSAYNWALGSLTPGTGAEQTGNTRIRSEYIPVTLGTEIKLEAPTNRLLVYSFNAQKGYVADSTWLGLNTFTITDESVAFVRILIRKNTSNAPITSEEIAGLAAGLSINYVLPDAAYTDIQKLDEVYNLLDGTRNINFEVGSINAGKPVVATSYARTKDFVRAHAGDTLVVAPTEFGLYYVTVYLFDTDNVSGYTGSASISTTLAGNSRTYTFTADCWFKVRATNKSGGAVVTPQDLYLFNAAFTLSHYYDADELLGDVQDLKVDYDTINGNIGDKFNLAIQTDTHMAKYVGYTTSEYEPSDFNALKSVVKSVNLLDIDVFAHLGDFIRGYQCDPAFESRETADAMLECYRKVNTNKAFVIGNHDDGCLFYSNATYNDKQSVEQVMFPSEQFNRYTKFGVNNKGISNYYYSDINGVRVITLYQRDFDYSQAVPAIEAFKIGTNQINWLKNTALDTALPVIVLTHAPLVSSLYATSREGFDDVLSALTTFISNGGTVIAVLSGHTHAQNSAKVDGINHIVFKNGYDFFELVSVDLTNRTIDCSAINNSSLTDMSFTY